MFHSTVLSMHAASPRRFRTNSMKLSNYSDVPLEWSPLFPRVATPAALTISSLEPARPPPLTQPAGEWGPSAEYIIQIMIYSESCRKLNAPFTPWYCFTCTNLCRWLPNDQASRARHATESNEMVEPRGARQNRIDLYIYSNMHRKIYQSRSGFSEVCGRFKENPFSKRNYYTMAAIGNTLEWW